MFEDKPQIFEGLSEESLERIIANSTLHGIDAGVILVHQGDAPASIYVTVRGALRTYRSNSNGNEATIRMLKPGDSCMEAVMFMGGPSPINVEAVENSVVLMIPERVVKAQVLDDAQFATNLLRIVARHYKNTMHQVDGMNMKTPLQRVGYYFLLRHIEAGHDTLDVDLPFQKKLIANYLGMTPETFSRVLKQMREYGIDVGSSRIRLRDAFTLCHFCDTDSAALCPHGSDAVCSRCPPH
ncbi:cAMP-binding proteins - catabolite gene activator and regulatory subunit of cAMP-dependent protein kinase [Thioalkalivibrio nitratireducens DSM 14787]|uniref:cAMP-binding proteins-catabolite gene activator and regulatory subunit of cAMP-dependent protein kinase n=1 Tax=Thioalkalivibrio nitratireducens (strain DSM 14787 / UNIQEM 213 / ALEN2) TaxID=1255043 RepID=L0DWQ1_THIND|nr:cAMP-binding proteins - catabolite gene activator and regulatory subunit of cAMP-dependent protein kinase [Thioalkalivibrio nitratireducens DSM 14787]